ncbi:YihY family protein [Synechococcus sp. PCC 7335]|uniref:YihY/virulence factor BrkB family protein n=1 Tax=Synechococcus sp. (strain ATCC 29403 / PCC 7335) TaxID=91464 RepID=UPI00017EBF9B|nr:YihY/virulence factor BrkB family protein [Synechococcus sp. PCC 7335]EDX84916.1 YihY family protein [Synechococcus sp. PCC 7335]
MNPSILWSLLKQTVAEWQRDKVSRLAAALAYYTTFALAPILIIAIAIASFLFEQSAVQSRILEQIQSLLGENAAGLIEEMLTSRSTSDGGFWATIISVGLLILGASGLFVQLQDALNTVWNVVARKDEGIWGLVRDRLLSFGMVVAIGFLLMVSLIVSAGLSAVSGMFGELLPGWDLAWQILNTAFSFGVITLLFAMVYKVLPDVRIAWSDVWTGAAITAFLFTIGKALIGLYIGNSSVASAYGAAGSFVVLLLWIYYSSQILLFGAEFTQVYANRFGSNIRPDSHAKFAPDATAEEKGTATADKSKLPQSRSEYRALRRSVKTKRGEKFRAWKNTSTKQS